MKIILLLALASLSACATTTASTPLTNPDAPVPEPARVPLVDPTLDIELPMRAIGPVAFIDGGKVPAALFNIETYKLTRRMRGRLPSRMIPFYKPKILERVLQERLIALRAEALGMSVSSADLDAKIAAFTKRMGGPQKLERLMQTQNITTKEFQAQFERQLLMEQVLDHDHGVKVTDADVRAHYDANTTAFTTRPEVAASHILLKLAPKATDAEAETVRVRAQALTLQARQPGADFANLAKQHSEGPSASRGGDLGSFTAKRMVKPFSDAAFSMKPGEVSEPVKTRFGWHIIKVHKKTPSVVTPFAQASAKLRVDLERKKMLTASRDFMVEARKRHKIELLEDNIKVTVTPPPAP